MLGSLVTLLARVVEALDMREVSDFLAQHLFSPPQIPTEPYLPFMLRNTPGVQAAFDTAAQAYSDASFWAGVAQGGIAMALLAVLLVNSVLLWRWVKS